MNIPFPIDVSTVTHLRRELFRHKMMSAKDKKMVKSRQTTTSQPNSRQFSGPVAPCVFVFPPWRVSCVLCNLVKMASPDREWFRAAIPANMLETLVIQTCAFLQEEDWDSIVPPERRSISLDRRKQREKFRSKETMEKRVVQLGFSA